MNYNTVFLKLNLNLWKKGEVEEVVVVASGKKEQGRRPNRNGILTGEV